MIRSILRAILESLRFEWRMQVALHRMARNDDDEYARDTADLAAFDRRWAYRRGPQLFVSSLNPAEVGRQAVEGDAIKDVARWLEYEGWTGDEIPTTDGTETSAGRLQRFAGGLLRRREKYERGAEVTS